MDTVKLSEFIKSTIRKEVDRSNTQTVYREPLVGYAAADDPLFEELRHSVEPTHLMPKDLLPGAQSVVSFFLPFDPMIVEANARHEKKVAFEWAQAYIETRDLLIHITNRLIDVLAKKGIHAAGKSLEQNFDSDTLISQWSYKSVALIAGIGSFGVHHMLITESGCAGRFGSIIIDAVLPMPKPEVKVRCLYFYDGSCLECISKCPVNALSENKGIDKQLCWKRCLVSGKQYAHLGLARVCCKCGTGPCAVQSPV